MNELSAIVCGLTALLLLGAMKNETRLNRKLAFAMRVCFGSLAIACIQKSFGRMDMNDPAQAIDVWCEVSLMFIAALRCIPPPFCLPRKWRRLLRKGEL